MVPVSSPHQLLLQGAGAEEFGAQPPACCQHLPTQLAKINREIGEKCPDPNPQAAPSGFKSGGSRAGMGSLIPIPVRHRTGAGAEHPKKGSGGMGGALGWLEMSQGCGEDVGVSCPGLEEAAEDGG